MKKLLLVFLPCLAAVALAQTKPGDVANGKRIFMRNGCYQCHGTVGTATYGGGRYLLDTAKGADLGGADRVDGTWLTIDLNFLYHPSCRYNDAWECPLAPDGNTTRVAITAGERLHHNPL